MRIIHAIATLLFLASAPGYAATITVMKDGSGDFTLIQPAADSAAPGDTILIGPGRWEEVTEFYFNSGVRRDAHLVVRVDNLTILGTSNEDAIIGPTVLNDLGGYPVGVVMAENVTTTKIESLRVENLWAGIYGLGQLFVTECVAFACTDGFAAFGDLTIIGSTARDCTNDGIHMLNTAGTLYAEGCEVVNCELGISVSRPAGRADIRNCAISGGRAGVQFDQTLGTMSDCIIQGVQFVGVVVTSGSSVEMTDCQLDNNGRHLDFGSSSSFLGVGNRLGSFNLYGIWIGAPGDFVWNGNDFLYTAQYQVYVSDGFEQIVRHYDFTGNYWGTTDPAIIASNIRDFNDWINVRAIIDFSPFAEEPVPVKQQSIGGLKSLFRRN